MKKYFTFHLVGFAIIGYILRGAIIEVMDNPSLVMDVTIGALTLILILLLIHYLMEITKVRNGNA